MLLKVFALLLKIKLNLILFEVFVSVVGLCYKGFMKVNLSLMHVIVGVIGLVSFILTGQYMDIVHEHLVNMEDGPRMIYRATHIYLLLVSVLNICIGVYRTQTYTSTIQKTIHTIISLVILLAPFLMLIEFFYGTRDINTQRVYAYWSLISLFVVSLLMLLSQYLSHSAKRDSNK